MLGAYTFGISSTQIQTEGTYFKDLSAGAYNVTPAILATMPDRPTGYTPSARVRILVFAHAGLQYKTYFIFSNDVLYLYKGTANPALKWGVISISELS